MTDENDKSPPRDGTVLISPEELDRSHVEPSAAAVGRERGRIDAGLETSDISPISPRPTRIHGRDDELATMAGILSRVSGTGQSEVVLVSGPSGIGKSFLVLEFARRAGLGQDRFAFGKFDQSRSSIPYSTAFQSIRRILEFNTSRGGLATEECGRVLAERLGAHGQVIVDVIPELEHLIGRQPPSPELPPFEAQIRFKAAFASMLGALADLARPLVLFLDDLQWLDPATLELLEYALSRANIRNLLFIGAYRESEVGKEHPLARTIEGIRGAGVAIHELRLGNLAERDTHALVCDALGCTDRTAGPLSDFLHSTADGSPHLTLEMLASMRDEGLLVRQPGVEAWTWDIALVRTSDHGGTILDLAISKLRRLPSATQAVLFDLACLGHRATTVALETTVGQSAGQIHELLRVALRTGAVVRSADGYAFSHDRIQEAAYSLIGNDVLPSVHLRIGQALLAQQSGEERDSQLFDITCQFNRALPVISAPEERELVAKLNLAAGKKAKSGAAYEAARQYYAQGSALASASFPRSDRTLAFELLCGWAGCELLCADFEAAGRLLPDLLSLAASKTEQAEAYRLKIELHLLRSESPAAVATALECLGLFDIKISAHPSQEELEAVFLDVWQKFDANPVESLLDLPFVDDPELEAAMSVLGALYEPAFFTDERLVGVHLCHMVSLTLERGLTKASAHAIGLFGFALGHYFGRYADGFAFCEIARALVKRHGLVAYEAKTLYSLELVSIWAQPLDISIETSEAAFSAAVRNGDILYACYACQHTLTDRLARGDSLDELAKAIDDGISFIEKTKFAMVLDVLVAQRRYVHFLRYGRGDRGIFSDETFDEANLERKFDTEQAPTGVCWHWIIKAQANFIEGSFDDAAELIERARPLMWSSIGHIQAVDFHLFRALALCALHSKEDPVPVEEIASHSQWLARWADANPKSFGGKSTLVKAELARIEGREQDAEWLYESAIRHARTNGMVHDEAIANEVAARFYARRGAERTYELYLHEAISAYARWGAKAKVSQLEALTLAAEANATGSQTSQSFDIDLAAILKVSNAISEEIHLDRLMARLLTVLLENAGAMRALLVSLREDRIWIDAEAGVNPGQVELRQTAADKHELPTTIIRHASRTLDSILIDDAAYPNAFSSDPYIVERRPRSVLCLPLVKRARLIGIVYLENHLVAGAFGSKKLAVLQLLASQAAVSLENARLFASVRNAEARLEERERELNVALDSMPALTWTSDGDGRNPWFNKRWYDYTGLTPQQAQNGGWKTCFHPDDRKASIQQWHRITTKREMGVVEARLRRRDGEYRWFLVRASPLCDSTGKIIKVYATESDIDDLKRAEALLAGEKRLLEMIATGQSLKVILNAVCVIIRELGRESLTSILLLDDDGRTLRTGAAPALPKSYSEAIDGIQIGPASGSCGTAAYRGEPVLVNDISTDPLWDGHRDIALKYGLRACWSTPIMSTSGAVLGTMAIYSRRIRELSAREREVMDRFTHLASIVIEQKRGEEALKTSEALLAEGQRISKTGSWSWNLATGEYRCSSEQRRLFGIQPDEGDLSYRSFLRRVHSEDRMATMRGIRSAGSEGQPFEQDFRIVLPDGTLKYIHGSGRPATDNAGRVGGYFGAMTDTTVQRLAAVELEFALSRTKESEHRQRTLIDMIPCHAWVSDPVTGGEFFSRQWLDYVGLTLEDVRGSGWQKSLHPDDVNRHAEIFGQAIERRAVGKVESRLRRHDGTYRWFLFTAQPLLNEAGETVKWYGTNIDIDDLKKAETLLEAEKQLFKMIATGEPLETILNALCQTVEVLADGALASIMLLDEERRRLQHAASPSLPSSYTAAIDASPVGPLEGGCGAAVYLSTRVSSDDIASDPVWRDFGGIAVANGLRSCTSTPIRASDGTVLGAFAIYATTTGEIAPATLRLVDQFTDLASIVIERRRADEALRKSEAFLAEGQRISHTGSWAWVRESDKLVWSEEHCRIFGYSIEARGGTRGDMLRQMLPEEREYFETAFREAVERKEDIHFEYQATLAPGVVKQLLCTGKAVVDETGNVVEFIGTTMDITQRKHVEAELQRSAERLRQVQEELAHVARTTTMGELAASIAHEVNQPLTGIVASGGAALRWLSRSTPDVNKAVESIKNVVQEGRRASDVIASIRKMFRNEPASKTPLDIREVIDNVAFLTRAELQSNRITLRLDLPRAPLRVLGDRVQLQQVFLNLFLNAVEAMKDLTDRQRTLSVSFKRDSADAAEFTVGDNGIGVAPELIDHVFRPFYTSKPGGLGMGLSICRSIVEDHGGRMLLLRDHKQGCRFQFSLPTIDD